MLNASICAHAPKLVVTLFILVRNNILVAKYLFTCFFQSGKLVKSYHMHGMFFPPCSSWLKKKKVLYKLRTSRSDQIWVTNISVNKVKPSFKKIRDISECVKSTQSITST